MITDDVLSEISDAIGITYDKDHMDLSVRNIINEIRLLKTMVNSLECEHGLFLKHWTGEEVYKFNVEEFLPGEEPFIVVKDGDDYFINLIPNLIKLKNDYDNVLSENELLYSKLCDLME